MSNLNGKVAIVTGASKGIGAAIARAFAGAGAAVVVNYATSREGADRVVADIVEAGGRAVAVQGDVGKAADVRRLFAEARRAFDRVDVVVNNAGVFAFQAIEAVTEAEFHRQFDTNVLGIVLTAQEAVQHFGAEGGSIINISSVAASYPYPGGNAYGGTKAFVRQFSLGLRSDLHGTGVRVTSIEPGMAETEFTLVRTGGNQEASDTLYGGANPMTGEDIANTLYWVATLPPHININALELMPVSQSWAGFQVARAGA